MSKSRAKPEPRYTVSRAEHSPGFVVVDGRTNIAIGPFRSELEARDRANNLEASSEARKAIGKE